MASTSRREEEDALSRRIREMSEQPGSGVRMCHDQGKTAVYISRDHQFMVFHPPNGPIRYVPWNGGSRSGT